MPQAVSDRGSQMKAKSIRAFFKDLGIGQLFCRPHTPNDNAEMESFFATLKCERLYRGSYDSPFLAEADIASFITYYNGRRLHQGIGFVTPQERHEGKDQELQEERRRGLQVARMVRLINGGHACGESAVKGLEAERIETRDRSPVLQRGENEEVTGGQDYSIIPPAVVS